jgi:hypothetical protein
VCAVTDSQYEVGSSYPPKLAARFGSIKKSLFGGNLAMTTSYYINNLLSIEENPDFTSKGVKAEAISTVGSSSGDEDVIKLDDDETQLELHHQYSYIAVNQVEWHTEVAAASLRAEAAVVSHIYLELN